MANEELIKALQSLIGSANPAVGAMNNAAESATGFNPMQAATNAGSNMLNATGIPGAASNLFETVGKNFLLKNLMSSVDKEMTKIGMPEGSGAQALQHMGQQMFGMPQAEASPAQMPQQQPQQMPAQQAQPQTPPQLPAQANPQATLATAMGGQQAQPQAQAGGVQDWGLLRKVLFSVGAGMSGNAPGLMEATGISSQLKSPTEINNKIKEAELTPTTQYEKKQLEASAYTAQVQASQLEMERLNQAEKTKTDEFKALMDSRGFLKKFGSPDKLINAYKKDMADIQKKKLKASNNLSGLFGKHPNLKQGSESGTQTTSTGNSFRRV